MSLNRTIAQLRNLRAVCEAVLALPLRGLTAAVETERSARALGAIPVFSPIERAIIAAPGNAVHSVERSCATEQGTPTARISPAQRSAQTRYSREKSESVCSSSYGHNVFGESPARRRAPHRRFARARGMPDRTRTRRRPRRRRRLEAPRTPPRRRRIARVRATAQLELGSGDRTRGAPRSPVISELCHRSFSGRGRSRRTRGPPVTMRETCLSPVIAAPRAASIRCTRLAGGFAEDRLA